MGTISDRRHGNGLRSLFHHESRRQVFSSIPLNPVWNGLGGESSLGLVDLSGFSSRIFGFTFKSFTEIKGISQELSVIVVELVTLANGQLNCYLNCSAQMWSLCFLTWMGSLCLSHKISRTTGIALILIILCLLPDATLNHLFSRST